MIQARTTPIKHLRIRSAEQGNPILEGYAAVFDIPSVPLYELGNRREIIRPGAFTNALKRADDVRLLQNHDANLILARTASGTLTLTQDEAGLFFSAELPDTSYARDLVTSMRRGDINQCSFAFEPQVEGIEVIDGEEFNVVRDAGRLLDVSAVTYPAYPATMAMVRSLVPVLNEQDRRELMALLNTSDSGESHRESAAAVDSVARRKREIDLLSLNS